MECRECGDPIPTNRPHVRDTQSDERFCCAWHHHIYYYPPTGLADWGQERAEQEAREWHDRHNVPIPTH